MRTYRQLKKEYNELLEQYLSLHGEKLELEYQCEMLCRQDRKDLEQREEIYHINQNARKLKHDMKNHIMVIASYLQENKVDDAKEYLSKILDKLNHMYTYVETGNSLLNHILNRKLEEAQKRGMKIKAQIENLPFARMDCMDFSAVLSNLLDNAINADAEDPILEVEILRKRGYDCICIKNRVDTSVFNTNPELKTTKQDKSCHGYGILQVKEIVEKYEGLVDFYEEGQMFTACVMIPS